MRATQLVMGCGADAGGGELGTVDLTSIEEEEEEEKKTKTNEWTEIN